MPRLALLAVLLIPAATVAAEPLVKPAKPPAGFTRVRFPEMGKEGAIPKLTGTLTVPSAMPKGMPTVTTVSAGVLSMQQHALITMKRLAALGLKGEEGGVAVLPELTLNGWAGSAPAKVKLTNLQVRVVKSSFGSDDKLYGDDFWLSLDQLLRDQPGKSELWMTFGEQTELTVSYPDKWVKRGDANGEKPPAPVENKIDADRVPVMFPLQPATYMVAPLSVNGTPMKAACTSRFEVSLTGTQMTAYVTKRTVLDHNLKDEEKEIVGQDGVGKVRKTSVAAVPKAAYAVGIGAGYKTPRELQAREAAAMVDSEQEGPSFGIGPGFLRSAASAQGVTLAVGTDGIPRVYAAVPKAAVVDPKAKK